MNRAPGEAFKEDGGDVKDSGLRFVGRSDDGEFRCLVFSELAALRAKQVSESAELFLDLGIFVSQQNDENSLLDRHPRKADSSLTTPEPTPKSCRSSGPLKRSGPRSLRMTPSTLIFLDPSFPR
jgi:hypothetical protein